jgi:uncharacterized 2Fe-2S/4Fe-4S cluster protein (DUF4445 family)
MRQKRDFTMAINFHFDSRTLSTENEPQKTVLELAKTVGLHIDARCGGKGSCGRCNVLLGAGRYRVFNEEINIRAEQRREVLSCMAHVLGENAEIWLPLASVISFAGARIADEMNIPPHTFNPHFTEGFGIAADIGTTTVVAALINLKTGRVLGRQSLYNQQILKADDVVSRISLCSETGNLETLKVLVIADTLNPLVNKLCVDHGIEPNEIVHVAVAGNTVMTHIFFGVSPVSIGVLPFKPVSRTFKDRAGTLGVAAHPDAIVEAVPAVSGYVGGDITADLHVCKLCRFTGLALLIDIGTNGEMAAYHDGKLTATATAAGPAFEGAGIRHGARATRGAIDTVRFDESLDFKITTIDDSLPIGLCGSAIIDFIAEGFRCGLINMVGRYDVELLKKRKRYCPADGLHACELVRAEDSATGKSIAVTEHDIAEVLKAKAAIYAGLKTLLTELGKTVCDLDNVILAGGFAKHITLENAFEIGLLPAIGTKKYEVIGNGSLAGAALLLLDKTAASACMEIIDRPQIINLNQTDHFTNFYQEALAIPNLDDRDFPCTTAE